MTEYRFIEPLDVLHLRGNRLFGESSDGGAALMPPWPSVFSGALRSWILTGAGVDPVAFGNGGVTLSHELDDVLGTPSEPGTFTIRSVNVACLEEDNTVLPTYTLPADVQVFEGDDGANQPEAHQLWPLALPKGLRTSLPLPQLPALTRDAPAKPLSGYRLTAEGWQRYLNGERLQSTDLVHERDLWTRERRLGIALESGRRAAADGMLYTTEAVSLSRKHRAGFLVGIGGVDPAVLPATGMLRLGGDGRGAVVHSPRDMSLPVADPQAVASSGRFRVVLTTPGIFPGGWRLPGLDSDGQWRILGASARLISAAVPRGGVVSGWDLANRGPKTAQRIAPTGSVYWFEGLEGGPEALGKLAENGLWGLGDHNDNPGRRAEGFNRFVIANA